MDFIARLIGMATILCLLVAILAFTPITYAANPDWPNGPNDDPRDAPPDDANWSEQWGFWSYIPDAALPTVRPEEIPLGAGLSIDRAWQVTTGDPRVVIGMTDCGIQWEEPDLIEKVRLNEGELPLPQGSASYDANGDGRVNIRDYDEDPRVYDANDNGVIDAGDLIRIFSDGIDGDGNGYADDIAGWDFVWNDNDPYDDTGAHHGTGVATWTMGKANDGWGHAGACPECMLIPLRVGDDFVGYVGRFNEALIYAVDNGAQIVLHANSTINFNATTRTAIDDAWERGVLYVTILGDAAGYHHVYPGALPHALPVTSIANDTGDADTAHSFFRLSNCSGWGEKNFVAASFDCASTPTGIIAGVAGLLYSRALQIDLDPPLSPGEVMQILAATATDVDIPESLDDPGQYPSLPGWDTSFGYGRAHARDAVDRVTPETIPPEAEITAPEWFLYVDPERTHEVAVRARADARRAASFSYVLEAASGVEPADEQFFPLCEETGLTDARDIECAFDPDSVTINWDAPWQTAFQFNVTLRLRVTDNLGNKGEDRRTFYLRHDPDLVEGYPLALGSSAESAPQVADMNGDGIYEIILAAMDGRLDVLNIRGESLPGWPRYTALAPTVDAARPGSHTGAPAYADGRIAPWRQGVWAAPAIGDLDGDGAPDIVVATMEGCIEARNANGNMLAGFPVCIDRENAEEALPGSFVESGIMAAPALSDLDDDGLLEIVVGAMDRYVYVWRADGSEQPGFPVLCQDPVAEMGARIVSSPAVGDLNGDGIPDIVVGTNEIMAGLGRTYAIHGDGALHDGGPYLPGWPVRAWGPSMGILPYIGEGTVTSPSLRDIDGDGKLEAFTLSGIGMPGGYDAEANRVWTGWAPFFGSQTDAAPGMTALCGMSFLVWADVNADGVPDLLASGNSVNYLSLLSDFGNRINWEAYLFAFDGVTGRSLPYFPLTVEDLLVVYGPTVAHLDEDYRPEILVGTGGFVMHAYNEFGLEPEGWPKFTGQWVSPTPVTADLDGDGYIEVILASRDGSLWVWRTCGAADRSALSRGARHDERNTGNAQTIIEAQDGPTGRCGETDDDADDADIDADEPDDESDGLLSGGRGAEKAFCGGCGA